MPSEKGMLTALLVALLVAEFLGLFNVINTRLYAATPYLNSLWMRLITDSASFIAFALYVLLSVLYDIKKTGRLERWTLHFVFSLAAGMAAVGVLKVLTGVPRPGEASLSLPIIQSFLNADYFAFPSGHATRASILAYSLGRRFPRWKALWWGWAIAISLSRLLLHVHWFSDVLFGLLLGQWVFMAVEATEDRWLPLYKAVIRKLRLEVFDVE